MDVESIVGNAFTSQYMVELPTFSLNVMSLQWRLVA
jgi:hypothetical protein